MTKGRCLGLVGGLGVGATTHYYEKLAQAHQQQGRALDIVITHAEIPRVRSYVEADDREGLAEYINSFIRRMQAAGAEMAAVPAVTPHICVRELMALSPLPVFSIFEPLVEEFKARSVRCAAVFGTRFVVRSQLFGYAGNVEIVQSRPEEMDYIHNTYMELAANGKGSDEQRRNLTQLAGRLRDRDGAELIVLAGTDLVVLFDETNTDFPYIDCAGLHIAAIANGLLSQPV